MKNNIVKNIISFLFYKPDEHAHPNDKENVKNDIFWRKKNKIQKKEGGVVNKRSKKKKNIKKKGK